jgi:hypothetical protein
MVSRTLAQTAPELPAPSPLARVEQRVGLTDFAISYSSPGVKGRTVWGELVPYDELWRTGANRATTLEAGSDFTFGGVKVSAGKYALLSIPGKSEWTVILNSQADLPGTRGYDEGKDVARAKLQPTTSPARERMTFIFSNTTDDATRLDLEWADLRLSIPIGVDTAPQVEAKIKAAVDDAWRPHFASARWLLDNDGDLDRALGYINTSESIKATWWNTWVKAQILAKQGDKAAALASAAKAQELGKSDAIYTEFFADQVAKSVASWQ